MTRVNKARTKQQVRIIAGKHRGRKLPVLDAQGLRPTTDRVRETLFNWLMNDIRGAQCLDLFAGSGALGFESLSRGAAYVRFVEKDKRAALSLGENMHRLNIAEEGLVDIFTGTAQQFLRAQSQQTFDIVFLDPPFSSDLLSSTSEILEESGWLKEGSLIYVEQQSKQDHAPLPDTWLKLKDGQAGQSNFSCGAD